MAVLRICALLLLFDCQEAFHCCLVVACINRINMISIECHRSGERCPGKREFNRIEINRVRSGEIDVAIPFNTWECWSLSTFTQFPTIYTLLSDRCLPQTREPLAHYHRSHRVQLGQTTKRVPQPACRLGPTATDLHSAQWSVPTTDTGATSSLPPVTPSPARSDHQAGSTTRLSSRAYSYRPTLCSVIGAYHRHGSH